MMQAFRNAAKPVVYLITITFLAWMILDLSGLTGRGGGFFTQTSAGSINGEAVDLRSYQAAVANAVQQRQQAGGASVTLEMNDEIHNEVWDQFVENTLISDQIKKYHITTSPDEITEYIKEFAPPEIRGSSEFQTAGNFDVTKYQRWLASPVGQQYVPMLEAQARESILRNKLYSAVTADVFMSDAALWERYRDENEQARISLSPFIGRNIVPDSAVPVSSAEAEAYYKAHRDEFARPRTAFMSFVAVPHKLDASDSAAALAHVRSVREMITGGQAFEEVAKRESSDTGSAAKGGELGEYVKGANSLDTTFAKAAFALPVNTLSEPVLSPFGYHLIEVTKKAHDTITVRHVLIPIELAGAHRAIVDSQLNMLQSEAAERLDGAALDSVARDLKVTIAPTGPVPFGTRVQLGVYVIPDAAVWAFEARKGETSPVIDAEAASYVFRLDSLVDAGTPDFVQVHDAAAAKVQLQKKDERAKTIAQDFIARVKKGASMADAAKALGVPNREFGPFSRRTAPLQQPKVVGAAFGLPQGALSDVIDTPEGLYVIKVIQRVPADSDKFVKEKDALRSQTIQSLRQSQVRDYIASLKASAKIVDRRSASTKTNAQNEAIAAAQQGKTTKN